MENIHVDSEPVVIRFNVNEDTELIRLEANGDIFVRGKLIENDREVVEGMREFVRRAKGPK